MKRALAFFLVVFLVNIGSTWASTRVDFVGRFEITAETFHKDVVPGAIQLFFEINDETAEKTFTQIKLSLDKEVKGNFFYLSKEQSLVSRINQDRSAGLATAFKLDGPPHKWYYVFVTESSRFSPRFDGTFYKVKDELANILTLLNAETLVIPEEWKNVGTVTLFSL
ncbi:MAG: hypothetical protein A3F16_04985 [Deltaproteobacteria bacterium RIFCSPHIGHO2_12_FULL_43_9]|nr:MAG: hypothetical protein A3F16_04985 [Deltaproteobacteria bacterium RIFCSPHIGHO2_12_FULL_43_9]